MKMEIHIQKNLKYIIVMIHNVHMLQNMTMKGEYLNL